MKKTTIHDVAKAAGVSISTVSRVVNNDPKVSPEIRGNVLNAINVLRYRPGISARLMGGQRSYWIALLYQNPVFNYIHQIQEGAEEACRQAGFMLSVHACQQTGPALEDEVRGIVEAFHPAGVVLTLPMAVQPGLCEALRGLAVPFVRIAPAILQDPSPRLYFDETAAAHRLTEHLIALGHRRVGLIAGLPTAHDDRLRDGYVQAMQAASLEVRPGDVDTCLFQFEIALQGARRMLMRAEPPTALIAANDDMAAGCIRAANQLGLRVPQDVSVAGFGNSYVAEIVSPRLTSVHVPTREMAKAAVDLIVSGRTGDPTLQAQVMPHRIVMGESSGPAPIV